MQESLKLWRTQIKLRLIQKNEELTDSYISTLRSRIAIRSTLGYTYGNIRYNYVSSDKRFKTTIFGNNREELNFLLNQLLLIIDDSLELDNVSITSDRNRKPVGRRSSSLDGIGLNETNYRESFRVDLFRVKLFP